MDKDKRKKKSSGDDLSLREVHKVWGPAEAEVIKTFLESNGIQCIFRGKVAQSLYPISSDGMGEIKILVSEKDYDLAKKLLRSRKT